MEQTQVSTPDRVPLAAQSIARIVNLCAEAWEAHSFIALDELFSAIAGRAYDELKKSGPRPRLLGALDNFRLRHANDLGTREFARGHFDAVFKWEDPEATDPESRVIRALARKVDAEYDVRLLLDATAEIIGAQGGDVDSIMRGFLELAHHFLFVDDSQHYLDDSQH